MNWQPMETAPKDRIIEVCGKIDTTHKRERIFRAEWNEIYGCWCTVMGNVVLASKWSAPECNSN